MKEFKFKLDGLLKVREFKEKKIKIELGEILKEISSMEQMIKVANDAIEETYKAQEDFLKDSASGGVLQFFPQFINSKKADIKNKELKLVQLRESYSLKIKELSVARGEVKIMENFKTKKHTEWKKERNKKELDNIEEIISIRRNSKMEDL